MTAPLEMAVARSRAESLMTSGCTIRAKGTGDPVTDPTTGAVTVSPGAVAYTGKCRIKPGATQSNVREAGGAEVFAFDFEIWVPFEATAVREHMTVVIDSSPDLAAVGLELEVQKVPRGDQITKRRLLCNEVA